MDELSNKPWRYHYAQAEDEGLYRRSLYTIWKRTAPPPSMLIFDAADRDVCTVRRRTTSTPLQALVLLNDPQYLEACRMLAERMIGEGGDTPAEQLTFGFRALTGRSPAPEEARLITPPVRARSCALYGGSPKRSSVSGHGRVPTQ